MKQSFYTLFYKGACCALALLPLPEAYAQAEGEQAAFVVSEKTVERTGDALRLRMRIDVSALEVPAGEAVVCTPLIEAGDSVRALTPLVLNSRVRQILYERTGRAELRPVEEFAYRRRNGEQQQLEYAAETPYADWMRRAEVSVAVDACGCGWEAERVSRSPLFALRLAEPVVIDPVLAYLTPQAEAVKARKLEGSAFLDFPVNRTEIHPDYRDNPSELAKIRRTIEQVREDPYATITGVSIKGYASPEGSYTGNAYLAEHRAKALLTYVRGLYDLGEARLTVDFEPEDWEGLALAVERGDLPDKAELLAIIRADEPKDWDAREGRLKRLNGGESYRFLLREVYPALRHSDYEVDYQIRNFSVDEARALMFTDPSKLSLNEMFRVAQTYEAGSPEFNEIFETAVRLYPDDPVSNLNAAVNAIALRQTERAKRYLAKAADTPERTLAEAALRMLEGDLKGAEGLLRGIEREPAVEKTVEENLRQIEENYEF